MYGYFLSTTRYVIHTFSNRGQSDVASFGVLDCGAMTNAVSCCTSCRYTRVTRRKNTASPGPGSGSHSNPTSAWNGNVAYDTRFAQPDTITCTSFITSMVAAWIIITSSLSVFKARVNLPGIPVLYNM